MSILARTVCDTQLVLYRTSEGRVVALEDACWHRLLPLSMGRIKGDEVDWRPAVDPNKVVIGAAIVAAAALLLARTAIKVRATNAER